MGDGTRKFVATVVAVVAGLLLLVAAVVWGLSSAEIAEECLPGYDSCRARAGSAAERLDCRIELVHCRIHGAEHWLEGHSGG